MLCNLKCTLRTSIIFIIVATTRVSSSNGLTSTDGHLMKTQDGYIVENGLQTSEQDIHLEDFFWTGSGDGPPAYIRKPIIAGSETDGVYGRETIIKTSTVVATVYISENSGAENDDHPLCFINCDDKNGLPMDNMPSDRRFWLLTVVAGYFLPQDFPVLEEKLAKLYRVAFTRQQSWHLGIINKTENDNNRTQYRRKRNLIMQELNKVKSNHIPLDNELKNRLRLGDHNIRHHALDKRSTNTSTTSDENSNTDSYKINAQRKASSSGGKTQRVSVLIHNVTVMSENDMKIMENIGSQEAADKSLKLTNQTEIVYSVFVDGKPVLATTAADDMRLVTELEAAQVMEKVIYTKAEPYLKEPQATPLIPATSTKNSSLIAIISDNPLIFSLGILVILLLVILLVGLLFMTRAKRQISARIKRLSARETLVTPKKHHNNNNDLNDNSEMRTIRSESDDGIDNIAYDIDERLKDINAPDSSIAASRKHNHRKKTTIPHIHFPQPPPTSSSPTSISTSDSSIYYVKNHYHHPTNTDEKFHINNVTSSKKKSKTNYKHVGIQNQHQDIEGIYATIQKKTSNKKHKQKRKYLSENRVASIEDTNNDHLQQHHQHQSQIQLSSDQQSTPSSDSLDQLNKQRNRNYKNESLNIPHQILDQYHHNKILEDPNFNSSYGSKRKLKHSNKFNKNGDDNDEDDITSNHDQDYETYTETYNKEMYKTLQLRSPIYSDGSFGSYLSMASIRSFPKCSVPESLSRILEPVTLTHLDHSDDPANRTPKIIEMKTKKTMTTQQQQEDLASKDKLKRFIDNPLNRSQSDGADPGVIGPIVWQMHKKQMEDEKMNSSPIRDPIVSRTRYQGLLEDAINLYANTEDVQQDETNITNDVPGAIRQQKDFRGKSAIIIRTPDSLSRTGSGIIHRPVTAGTSNTINDYTINKPPSPYRKAWGSGTPSPLVRPLSAGPFHRPTESLTTQHDPNRITSSPHSTQLSTAPLIEAIQNELKKFNTDAK